MANSFAVYGLNGHGSNHIPNHPGFFAGMIFLSQRRKWIAASGKFLTAPYVEEIDSLHKKIKQLEQENAAYREKEFTEWKESNLCQE